MRKMLLLIAGDEDRTVDYTTGARAIFTDAMRQRFWDQDWFEDPVWRKERITAINAHFITAFLDRYLKGDESRSVYLDVPVPESSAGVWPAATPLAYDAYSPGGANITVWKGFQRNHAAGLELLQAQARPTP